MKLSKTPRKVLKLFLKYFKLNEASIWPRPIYSGPSIDQSRKLFALGITHPGFISKHLSTSILGLQSAVSELVGSIADGDVLLGICFSLFFHFPI